MLTRSADLKCQDLGGFEMILKGRNIPESALASGTVEWRHYFQNMIGEETERLRAAYATKISVPTRGSLRTTSSMTPKGPS